MRSSLPLRLLVPASLVLLVGTLATLQYRWLGQVSEAERSRLRASLSQRASEFADDFDREIVRLYLSLQVDSTPLDRGDWTAFAKSYDVWHEAARFPEMLRAVYLTTGSTPELAPRKYRSGCARVRRRALARVARARHRTARQDELVIGGAATAATAAARAARRRQPVVVKNSAGRGH